MNTQQFRPAVMSFILLTLITGIVYPLGITFAAQLLFPAQANGSLITVNDTVIGSAWIGQPTKIEEERYFSSRPSAVDYMQGSSLDALGSSGASNLGSTSAVLAENAAAREAAFRESNDIPAEVAVPTEMLFASGSGLDPHISPEAARLQIARIAAARGLELEQVAALVEQWTEPPQFGILGQPRVNVLLLNLALDALE